MCVAQCCFSVEAMKPSKLKRDLNTKHPKHVEKNLSFFEGKEFTLKRQKLDSKRYFALAIAKQTKPNSIGETLVKPFCCDYGEIDIRRIRCKKIEQISLSDDTVKRRILPMSLVVKQQVIEEIKASPLFVFQVKESTDVALCSQVVVFVRYIYEYDIKNEFLFFTSILLQKVKMSWKKLLHCLIQKTYSGINYARYA